MHKAQAQLYLAKYASVDATRPVWVYFIGAKDNADAIKIGSTTDMKQRLRDLQVGSPLLLVVHGKVLCDLLWERELHEIFVADRLVGEWFRRSPKLDEVVKFASDQDFGGMVSFLLKDYCRDDVDDYRN